MIILGEMSDLKNIKEVSQAFGICYTNTYITLYKTLLKALSKPIVNVIMRLPRIHFPQAETQSHIVNL